MSTSTETKLNKEPSRTKTISMKDLYGGNAKAGEGKTDKARSKSNIAYRILIKPLVTEKATNIGAQNKYVFMVDTGANKIDIAKAIEEMYAVKPTKVNLLNMDGKKKTGRHPGRRKNWKKAIVTLPAGKTIQVYEGT